MWSPVLKKIFGKTVFYNWQIFDEVLNRVAQSHWLRLRSIKTDCHRVPRTKSVVRKFILKSALRCHRKQNILLNFDVWLKWLINRYKWKWPSKRPFQKKAFKLSGPVGESTYRLVQQNRHLLNLVTCAVQSFSFQSL